MAREATEAITKIKEQFYEETRKRIECETKKVFDSFSLENRSIQSNCTDQNSVLKLSTDGICPRERNCHGERQILSLAFIAAMARLSGEDAPVIMDTPFARLSGEHLQNVLTKSASRPCSLLIVFVTGFRMECCLAKWFRNWLIGAEYNLNFVDGITSIEEVPLAKDRLYVERRGIDLAS